LGAPPRHAGTVTLADRGGSHLEERWIKKIELASY